MTTLKLRTAGKLRLAFALITVAFIVVASLLVVRMNAMQRTADHLATKHAQ